ncbi:hypothetical protein NMY22_g5800 [Coprinellus aureogranulatus]|nr:hypothetical protein NMY22_g5800 [Coprinellus aureogranulatus]
MGAMPSIDTTMPDARVMEYLLDLMPPATFVSCIRISLNPAMGHSPEEFRALVEALKGMGFERAVARAEREVCSGAKVQGEDDLKPVEEKSCVVSDEGCKAHRDVVRAYLLWLVFCRIISSSLICSILSSSSNKAVQPITESHRSTENTFQQLAKLRSDLPKIVELEDDVPNVFDGTANLETPYFTPPPSPVPTFAAGQLVLSNHISATTCSDSTSTDPCAPSLDAQTGITRLEGNDSPSLAVPPSLFSTTSDDIILTMLPATDIDSDGGLFPFAAEGSVVAALTETAMEEATLTKAMLYKLAAILHIFHLSQARPPSLQPLNPLRRKQIHTPSTSVAAPSPTAPVAPLTTVVSPPPTLPSTTPPAVSSNRSSASKSKGLLPLPMPTVPEEFLDPPTGRSKLEVRFSSNAVQDVRRAASIFPAEPRSNPFSAFPASSGNGALAAYFGRENTPLLRWSGSWK